MSWLVASSLMAFCSFVMYMAARKSSLLKYSTEFTNLSMYLIPTLLFSIFSLMQGVNLRVTPYQLLILAIFAICFSWLGNVASLKSIERAPNPGYSLIISKSYVLMTMTVAYFFFGSELSLQSVFAILVIIAGSALLSIGKSSNPNVHRSWLPLSLLAFVCWGMISITSKYLLNLGVGVMTLLFYVNVMVTSIILIEVWIKKSIPKVASRELFLSSVMGISAAGFDYFMQQAFVTAPNIGYVNAINAASIVFVTVGAIIFYKDEYDWRKLCGVLLATLGLVGLVLGK